MTFAEKVALWLQEEARKENTNPVDLLEEWQEKYDFIQETLEKQQREETMRKDLLKNIDEYPFCFLDRKNTAQLWFAETEEIWQKGNEDSYLSLRPSGSSEHQEVLRRQLVPLTKYQAKRLVYPLSWTEENGFQGNAVHQAIADAIIQSVAQT